MKRVRENLGQDYSRWNSPIEGASVYVPLL